MDYAISPGIHHAVADGRNIFLNVDRDRYFALAEAPDRAFSRYLAGGARSSEDDDALLRLVTQGVLTTKPNSAEPPNTSPVPIKMLSGRGSNIADGLLIIRAMWALLRAKFLHRRVGLAGLLRHIQSASSIRTDVLDVLGPLASAFEHASLLIRTRDECLPYSAALTVCLRRSGIPAQLVVGVSGRPFAAHCWVQVGDVLVNDRLDHVSLFTPILVR